MHKKINKMKHRIIIKSNGSQSGFGYGENMTTFRNTEAGKKKAVKFMTSFWESPFAVIDGVNFYAGETSPNKLGLIQA